MKTNNKNNSKETPKRTLTVIERDFIKYILENKTREECSQLLGVSELMLSRCFRDVFFVSQLKKAKKIKYDSLPAIDKLNDRKKSVIIFLQENKGLTLRQAIESLCIGSEALAYWLKKDKYFVEALRDINFFTMNP